jgi:DNA helicase-2/ATP-dependent DNA helicase PcrA
MVSLISSPEKFFENLRRPTPVLFSQSATEGTHFHSCIEEYFSASDDAETELTDTEIGANFLGSRFADRNPFAIEQQIEFVLAGVVVVCKLDAVFESEGLYEVVDWKSGKTPDASDLASRSIQLALYRIALSEWLGVGVEQIRVSFFFAADGKEVAPETLLSKLELENKLAEVRRARLS